MPESIPKTLDRDIVMHVASTCLCLHTQRAARALARLFDTALRPHGLNNGQFSLLMALNRPAPPSIGTLAQFLAMDRTSLTAALKPLERRGLVQVLPDQNDRRSRLVQITADGVALLEAALPTWRATHAALDGSLGGDVPARLRADLLQVPTSTAAVTRKGT